MTFLSEKSINNHFKQPCGPVAVLALASPWVRKVAFRSREISIIPTMAVLLACGIAILTTNLEVCPGMGGGPMAVLALASPWVREVAFRSREIAIIPTMIVLLAGGIAILNHKYAGTPWYGRWACGSVGTCKSMGEGGSLL